MQRMYEHTLPTRQRTKKQLVLESQGRYRDHHRAVLPSGWRSHGVWDIDVDWNDVSI